MTSTTRSASSDARVGRHSRLLILLPYLLIVSVTAFGFWRVEENRQEGRRALCSALSGVLDATFSALPTHTETQRANLQFYIDAVANDLNHRLEPVECRVELHPIVIKPGG